jgi:hypothetical protein
MMGFCSIVGCGGGPVSQDMRRCRPFILLLRHTSSPPQERVLPLLPANVVHTGMRYFNSKNVFDGSQGVVCFRVLLSRGTDVVEVPEMGIPTGDICVVQLQVRGSGPPAFVTPYNKTIRGTTAMVLGTANNKDDASNVV